MKPHPYLTEVIINPHTLVITTHDREYDFLEWCYEQDKLFVREQGRDQDWEPFGWCPIPPGGDAAMSLEQDVAEYVQHLFSALTSS